MKGILLAGGAGSRLHPLTQVMSKQLLPVYDKPMIFYPLSTLMLGGIKDILVISTPRDLPHFANLLGDGSRWGLSLEYAEQPEPKGIAQSILIGADFLGGDCVTLILGDNIFYGKIRLDELIRTFNRGAVVFGYPVMDPHRYGVVSFDDNYVVTDLVEKPRQPPSSYAIPGLYLYDSTVVDRAARLKPSRRGELEITDLNRAYLTEGMLRVELLGRGVAWLDTGTHGSLLDAGNFIQTLEARQGLKIACLEEIALRRGFIDWEKFIREVEGLPPSPYREYLEKQVERKKDPIQRNLFYQGR